MASLNATATNNSDMAAKGNQNKNAAEIIANKLKVPKIFDTEVGDARSDRSDHLKGKFISITDFKNVTCCCKLLFFNDGSIKF